MAIVDDFRMPLKPSVTQGITVESKLWGTTPHNNIDRAVVEQIIMNQFNSAFDLDMMMRKNLLRDDYIVREMTECIARAMISALLNTGLIK